jgi:hypothetical protein
MSNLEKQELLTALREGREALGAALDGIDETLAARQPPTGWSILGCVEHLATTEEYLLGRLQAAKRIPAPIENSAREKKIAAYAMNRARRIEAPPQAHPHGRFATVPEALAAFDAARAQVVRYLESLEGDLRCWVTDHLLVPSPVTCYEMFVMIAAHPKRHAEQIVEIRQVLGGEAIAH